MRMTFVTPILQQRLNLLREKVGRPSAERRRQQPNDDKTNHACSLLSIVCKNREVEFFGLPTATLISVKFKPPAAPSSNSRIASPRSSAGALLLQISAIIGQ